MKRNKDQYPSKDPGMLHHYFAHYLSRARYALQPGKEDPVQADRYRKELLKILGGLRVDEACRKGIIYLEQNPWKSSDSTDKAKEHFDSLESSENRGVLEQDIREIKQNFPD